jgi:predicted TIM-barrel fold metal-dependent hydrolase
MPSMPFPPPGACDCHVHVIGPKARFPLAADRRYTPKDALAAELAAMLARSGLDRVVLVQPSFYRTDNACMLDAMAQFDEVRGVAVLPAQVSDDELDALDDAGVRGLRVNIASAGAGAIETIRHDIEAAAALCERHGWHVQIFIAAELIEPLSDILLKSPVATVIDHFGLIGPDTSLKAESGPLRALLRLLHSDKVWVKISGAYRIADDPNDPRIGALAKRLGLGLAAYAAPRRAHAGQRPGTAVPEYRHARAARPGAALARRRGAGQARAGDKSGEALRVLVWARPQHPQRHSGTPRSGETGMTKKIKPLPPPSCQRHRCRACRPCRACGRPPWR